MTAGPSDQGSESGWATLIGIIICLSGNVVISFALNIQRLAHERIQRRRQAARRTPTESSATTYGTVHPPKTGDEEDGEEEENEVLYLRSKLWWTGLVLMAVGETGNFVAYGFAPASIVAPLGTVAILCNALIAPLVFNETFRLRDFMGIVFSTIGAVTIVLSANPQEEKFSPEDIWKAITEIPFLIYFTTCCVVALFLMVLSRRVGEKSITIDLGLVAIFGGFTALSTKGVSSLLSLSLYRVFTFPISYLLLFILISTAILQVKYLNKALARFSSTQVIPTQFVMFTLSVVLGSSILYKDFESATPARLIKFMIGCSTTFIGVYLITSKRPTPHQLRRRSIPHHLGVPSSAAHTETSRLVTVPSPTSPELELITAEDTPPSLIGTSFGYHFATTPTRTVERKGSRLTLPRGNGGRKFFAPDELSRHVWTRWTDSLRGSEEMGRTQSAVGSSGDEVGGGLSLRNDDTQSDIVDGMGSWNRACGNGVV